MIEQRFRPKPFRTHDPRQFSAHADRIPVRAPVSLAPVTVSEITDTMIGLPEDAVAQLRAEQFIRAALSFKAKQELRATRKPITIRIALPAQEDDTAEFIPDAVEILGTATSSDRWPQ